MMHAPILMAAMAMAISAPNAAHAEVQDGLLPAPPASARAGQCFAKVVVPPVCAPGGRAEIGFTPERIGWIRVICDKDATRDRISHVQRRLHDWGVYAGDYGGAYDRATAEAVKRFQSERHIEHGGYLSFGTIEALEGAPPAYGYIAPPAAMAQGYRATPVYRPPFAPTPVYSAPVYSAPVYNAPVYAAPVHAPAQAVYASEPMDGRRWLTWPGKTAY